MLTGESSQGGRMRFDLVLWYGEYNTQENSNLHLASIWGKRSHYCLFLRWAHVELSSLPSLREEMPDTAGSSHCVPGAQGRTWLSLLCLPWRTQAVLHRLSEHSKYSWFFGFCLPTTHLVQRGAIQGSQAGSMWIPSVFEFSQMCFILHDTFISCYSFRINLISEKNPG